MHAALRAVLAIAIMAALASRAIAQSSAKADPDWPCHQIKAPTFSLAAVWSGPELDLNSQSWRDESDIADLAAKMTQRRIPIADVESAIADFKAKAGADADAKLLRAFAAAFQDLSQQRSQILDGLERFGRKQRAMADRIRAENEAVQKSADQNQGGQTPPGPTARSGCDGTYASSTIAARQSLTSARPRRSLNSASEQSRAPCKRLFSDLCAAAHAPNPIRCAFRVETRQFR